MAGLTAYRGHIVAALIGALVSGIAIYFYARPNSQQRRILAQVKLVRELLPMQPTVLPVQTRGERSAAFGEPIQVGDIEVTPLELFALRVSGERIGLSGRAPVNTDVIALLCKVRNATGSQTVSAFSDFTLNARLEGGGGALEPALADMYSVSLPKLKWRYWAAADLKPGDELRCIVMSQNTLIDKTDLAGNVALEVNYRGTLSTIHVNTVQVPAGDGPTK